MNVKHGKDQQLLSYIKHRENDFIHLIKNRLGIVIQADNQDFYKTIITACKKFNCNPEEYYTLLTTCSDDSPLLGYLIRGVTIGETYFFRDKNQMQLLRDKILPDLILKKRTQNDLSLRIWSAGCASGEEIYTIAMLLHESLPDLKKWRLQLLGTDINTQSLQKAIAGRYGDWSMRSISEYFKTHYFIKEKKDYVLLPSVKEMAHFDYINLNDQTYPSIINGTNAQDLIICRNVLIYFDYEHITKLMQRLNACLVPEGYLLLGASDPINLTGTHLVRQAGKTALFVYELQQSKEVKTKEKHLTSPLITSRKKLPQKTRSASPVTIKTTIIKEDEVQKQISHLLDEGQWQAVLDLINDSLTSLQKTFFMLSAKASALANLGKLEQSMKVCQESILLNPNNKNIYFTYANILAELNKFDQAEEALRKSLFLDRNFVPAHFQLGLLLLRTNRKMAGIKSLKNALAITNTQDPNILVPGAQNISYGRLAEILNTEIALYN